MTNRPSTHQRTDIIGTSNLFPCLYRYVSLLNFFFLLRFCIIINREFVKFSDYNHMPQIVTCHGVIRFFLIENMMNVHWSWKILSSSMIFIHTYKICIILIAYITYILLDLVVTLFLFILFFSYFLSYRAFFLILVFSLFFILRKNGVGNGKREGVLWPHRY